MKYSVLDKKDFAVNLPDMLEVPVTEDVFVFHKLIDELDKYIGCNNYSINCVGTTDIIYIQNVHKDYVARLEKANDIIEYNPEESE